jgi:diacylglycerol kinase (ATP)
MHNNLKSTGGIKRIFKAFQYTFQGLAYALKHEAAFRQEMLICVPAMIGAWFVPVPLAERFILFVMPLMVLIVEIINSAIEAVVDRISTEHHELSGRAKDLGSAAVLLMFIGFIGAWLAIAAPLLFKA